MKDNHNNLNDYVKVHEGEWTGCIQTEFRDVPLSCLVDPEFSDERRGGPFEKVRSSDTAEVYRYTIDLHGKRELLYLKRFPHRSLADAIKHLFRPSRASRAFKAGLTLPKYGLHTPQMVAFLQKKDGPIHSEDILITHAMTNATALSDFLSACKPIAPQKKRDLMADLGRTIGQMHAAGICHGDLRGGNVFIEEKSDGWQFFFIDNERTVKYRLLPSRLKRKNLVQLNMQQANVSTTDRIRFLKNYRIAAGISQKKTRRLARDVFKATQDRFRQRAKTRTGIADASDPIHWNFQQAQLGHRNGVFRMDFAVADTAAQLLAQIETLMETGTVLKDDVSTRVVRCTYRERDVVIKRYNHQGLWHSLRHTIKGTRAKKCWRFGHLLTAAKISCAEPLGMIEERRCGIIHQSYIINAFVEGPLLYVPMNDPDCSSQQRQAIIKKSKRVLEQLGENRLTHSDMKASNLIIADGEPVLIDLDSMRQHHKGPYFRNRYQKMIRTFHRRLNGKK